MRNARHISHQANALRLKSKPLRLLTWATALAIALTACSAQTQPNASRATKLKVVASTSVWGSIVEAIAGDKVSVTSIIHSANQDPHSFEASVRDQAEVNGADLILLTGNGYDDFMNKLLAASRVNPSQILRLAPNDKVVRLIGGRKIADPHVWYDFEIVSKAATAITQKLITQDPGNTATYVTKNATLQKELSQLQARLTNISRVKVCSPSHPTIGCHMQPDYANILQPETVGLRLLAKFAVDATPKTTRQAVVNGTDISVKDMNYIKTLFFGERTSSGLSFGAYWPLRFLVLNAQETNPQIEQMIAWAKTPDMVVPTILTFSETLPAGQTYLSWMSGYLKQLEANKAQESIRF